MVVNSTHSSIDYTGRAKKIDRFLVFYQRLDTGHMPIYPNNTLHIHFMLQVVIINTDKNTFSHT